MYIENVVVVVFRSGGELKEKEILPHSPFYITLQFNALSFSTSAGPKPLLFLAIFLVLLSNTLTHIIYIEWKLYSLYTHYQFQVKEKRGKGNPPKWYISHVFTNESVNVCISHTHTHTHTNKSKTLKCRMTLNLN